MTKLIYLLLITGGFLSSYVVSLYSLAVYLDPEDLDALVPHMSARRRKFMLRLASDPRALMQTATVFKSFALIVITFLTTRVLGSIDSLQPIGSGYLMPAGLAIVWFLHLLFVEYLPRRTSRRAIETKAPRLLWLVTTIYLVFLPVVTLYRWALRQVRPEEAPSEVEKEEIVERAIETLADQAGIGEVIVEKEEKKMIGQIFLLDQTVVREIMVPRINIIGIDSSLSFRDMQALIKRENYSRFPVFDQTIDHVIGMLYVKDLFNTLPLPGEEFSMGRYLRKPYFVPESKIIGELLREFKASKLHIAVVVDEYGGVSGLVTMEDILEEIVGEIQDEHDTEEAKVVRMSDGRYLVDAGLPIDELQDVLDTDYEEGDYDTVGGLLYFLAGSVPPQGSVITWHDLEFEVLKIEGQRIKRVRLARKAKQAT